MIESFRNRQVDRSRPVLVYRNLRRPGGVWYSVMQHGLVVGHTREIALRDVSFVIRRGGFERMARTGRRNVHAFASGMLTPVIHRMRDRAWGMTTRYDRTLGEFMIGPMAVQSAEFVRMGPNGLRAGIATMKRMPR